MSRLVAFGITGVPEVVEGDDLAAILLAALAGMGEELLDGDLVVVSSKVVSKAEGRYAGEDREQAVDAQTVRIVAERTTPRGLTRIVESSSGPVLAAAGVDASNVPGERVLLLPADPDRSARRLHAALGATTGRRLGVVVTDTLGRPWRHGQVDAAIGAAGVVVGHDLAGLPDATGRVMEVTHRALADEIASAADLVKGKVDGVPAAVLRGLGHLVTAEADTTRADNTTRADAAAGGSTSGAASLLRGPHEDWFRLGHVEAVRAAMGVPPGTADVPPTSVVPGPVVQRLDRAIAVAMASPQWPDPPGADGAWVRPVVADDATVDAYLAAVGDPIAPQDQALAGQGATIVLKLTHPQEAQAQLAAQLVALGALAQRLLAAAWTEGLDAEIMIRPKTPLTAVVLRAWIR